MTLSVRGMRRYAEVKERSGECRCRVRIEGNRSQPSHLGGDRRCTYVKGKRADLGIVAGEGPSCGNFEGDSITGVVEGTSWRRCGVRSGRRRRNTKKRQPDLSEESLSMRRRQ